MTPAKWRRSVPPVTESSVPAASVVEERYEDVEESDHVDDDMDYDHDQYLDSKYDRPNPFVLPEDGLPSAPPMTPTEFEGDKSSRSGSSGVYVNPSAGSHLPSSDSMSDSSFDKLIKMLSAHKPPDRKAGATESAARNFLPKIEYSKMVNLSLTNLDEYMVCIYNLGYSRMWPTKFSAPTAKDLREVWKGDEDDSVRREAYLVLLNTIPPSLKYLVRNVRSGDVGGIFGKLSWIGFSMPHPTRFVCL